MTGKNRLPNSHVSGETGAHGECVCVDLLCCIHDGVIEGGSAVSHAAGWLQEAARTGGLHHRGLRHGAGFTRSHWERGVTRLISVPDKHMSKQKCGKSNYSTGRQEGKSIKNLLSKKFPHCLHCLLHWRLEQLIIFKHHSLLCCQRGYCFRKLEERLGKMHENVQVLKPNASQKPLSNPSSYLYQVYKMINSSPCQGMSRILEKRKACLL